MSKLIIAPPCGGANILPHPHPTTYVGQEKIARGKAKRGGPGQEGVGQNCLPQLICLFYKYMGLQLVWTTWAIICLITLLKLKVKA